MDTARFELSVDGQDYSILDDTFVEGAVRRQAEFAYLGEEDLKSRPDTREWVHDSWVGGAQWEKPRYGRNNQGTYFESGDLSFTDRAGAVQQSAELYPLDGTGLGSPSSKLIAWSEDGVDGAIAYVNTSGTTWQWYEWDAGTDTFAAVSGRTQTHDSGDVMMAGSAGADGRVYALMSGGEVGWYDPTANTNGEFDTGRTQYNGAAIWVDRDFVWVYNGDTIYSYAIASSYAESSEAKADDDDGIDVFSRAMVTTGKPIIPEWSCTRAIITSEGIFYVKNVFEGGLPIAKVYRVDRDAAGSHILTPTGSLPKGALAINIAHHLGSILVTTIPNYHRAVLNVEDQKVTVYHVTGKSIGAIGSPLGGTSLDESPVWFLGTYNEMLYIGGRKRLWMYDGRIGAFHAVHVEADSKYTDHGSGFTDMATVDSTKGTGLLFMHTSQDGGSNAPYFELMVDDSAITTANDTAFLTSNWFDFELPLEEKTIYELFYDVSDIRTDSTIVVQLSADGGAFSTVATILHTSADTTRIPITPTTGYKFQYKLVFSTDTVTSSPEPGRLYSIGFAAFGGEMVDVLTFTIDGKESMNIENLVQVPSDVYDLMATLRDNKEEVTVVHTYNQLEGDDPKTGSYRVMNVTAKHKDVVDGMYEVQLIEVPAA